MHHFKAAARSAKALLAALTIAIALTGCAEQPSTPASVTLRVADQLGYLQRLLPLAGEDKPDGYKIEWSNFLGGPSIVAAQTGGSVDIGWMQDTPVVFAQAAGSPIKVVAVGRPDGPNFSEYALAVAKNGPIQSVRDLKGKKVAFMQGTSGHYYMLQILESAGLSLKDIVPVASAGGTLTGAAPLLERGQLDAIAVPDPILATLSEGGKTRIIGRATAPIRGAAFFLVASDSALKDASKQAALEDFVGRVVRAYEWRVNNPQQAADAIAAHYQLPKELGPGVLERSLQRLAPIDEDAIASQQIAADAFHRIGLIKRRVDARVIFDTRFNAIVEANIKTARTAENETGVKEATQ